MLIIIAAYTVPSACLNSKMLILLHSLNGTLIVWDHRMNAELWRNHER